MHAKLFAITGAPGVGQGDGGLCDVRGQDYLGEAPTRCVRPKKQRRGRGKRRGTGTLRIPRG